ncbi:hypothetical protein [Sediminibacterium ginsengisoli]|uniref:Uncharacterized protein n=1 Tax=Sediminibacterium ginsengisoli TaxID=413434 RepID=A0A1T4R9S6_9BACT|nr:hypothetical protein [Sediminibacterium ginsengisoli]SKA12566.1 hypothetical protein SAMN04488132_11148 [Sediminibacterium ginsengisoli]
MRKILLSSLLLSGFATKAQLSEPFKELKSFSLNQHIPTDTTPYLSFYHKGVINYLYPLYKAAVRQEQLVAATDSRNYYESLSQMVSLTGDHATALTLQKASYESIPDSVKQRIVKDAQIAKDVQYADAKAYLLARAKKEKVIMLNEAGNQPRHRAFTASLLQELYQQGFRYLAVETLNPYNNASLDKVNILTGNFTCEPVAGEMIRKALETGFKLVPYEDTIASHTAKQREYAQAANIYNIIKKDSNAKILVHAGYGHIEEAALSDDHIPMAAYFKIISGIDPLTVNQVSMSEGATDNYELLTYENWLRIHATTQSVIPVLADTPIDPFETRLNDLYVIHPPTIYKNGRPGWLAMDGWRKEQSVSPAYQTLFIVQAYYIGDYHEKTIDMMVPADQTYILAPDGLYYLYLRKGKYKLVFRDKLYKMLGSKDLEVN